jgi:hypothetical protein
MVKGFTLRDFVIESNRIEGIVREPTEEEIRLHRLLLKLDRITVADLCNFCNLIEKGALLRDQLGMDVIVGAHTPPPGGVMIRSRLMRLLDSFHDLTPLEFHMFYEGLHPFMDCNGRSGRALWLKRMGGIEHAPLRS